MPPHGLYTLPRHAQYAAPTEKRVYSSLEIEGSHRRFESPGEEGDQGEGKKKITDEKQKQSEHGGDDRKGDKNSHVGRKSTKERKESKEEAYVERKDHMNEESGKKEKKRKKKTSAKDKDVKDVKATRKYSKEAILAKGYLSTGIATDASEPNHILVVEQTSAKTPKREKSKSKGKKDKDRKSKSLDTTTTIDASPTTKSKLGLALNAFAKGDGNEPVAEKRKRRSESREDLPLDTLPIDSNYEPLSHIPSPAQGNINSPLMQLLGQLSEVDKRATKTSDQSAETHIQGGKVSGKDGSKKENKSSLQIDSRVETPTAKRQKRSNEVGQRELKDSAASSPARKVGNTPIPKAVFLESAASLQLKETDDFRASSTGGKKSEEDKSKSKKEKKSKDKNNKFKGYNTLSVKFSVPQEHQVENFKSATLAPSNITALFTTLQSAIDFTQETAFFEAYLQHSHDTADPPPCLGPLTGCSLKKEEILRLSLEEGINISGALTNDMLDVSSIHEAAQRMRFAEEFLMLALHARVPVPLGPIAGLWSLFCPKYAQKHVDKYGSGQRTMTLFETGSNFAPYAARLHIAPRPVPFEILSFRPSPAASFSVAEAATEEGYPIKIVFLGNGYMHLRLDVTLLLKGKTREGGVGKNGVMEFVGVHEAAVKWCKDEDMMEVMRVREDLGE